MRHTLSAPFSVVGRLFVAAAAILLLAGFSTERAAAADPATQLRLECDLYTRSAVVYARLYTSDPQIDGRPLGGIQKLTCGPESISGRRVDRRTLQVNGARYMTVGMNPRTGDLSQFRTGYPDEIGFGYAFSGLIVGETSDTSIRFVDGFPYGSPSGVTLSRRLIRD
jgi:hypothetical protein